MVAVHTTVQLMERVVLLVALTSVAGLPVRINQVHQQSMTRDVVWLSPSHISLWVRDAMTTLCRPSRLVVRHQEHSGKILIFRLCSGHCSTGDHHRHGLTLSGRDRMYAIPLLPIKTVDWTFYRPKTLDCKFYLVDSIFILMSKTKSYTLL